MNLSLQTDAIWQYMCLPSTFDLGKSLIKEHRPRSVWHKNIHYSWPKAFPVA